MRTEASTLAANAYRAEHVVAPVHVVALVSGERLRHLQRSGSRACVLEPTASASSLVRRMEEGPASIVLLDPMMVRSDALDRIVGAVDRTGCGLVLHTALTTEAARLVVEIGARLPSKVVFDIPANEGTVLAKHLLRGVQPSVPALVMSALAGRLRPLPPALATEVIGLFGWMPIPSRVVDFIATVNMERRSVERALRRAGFRGVSALLMIARLARTWADMEDRSLSIGSLAVRNGFHSSRTFADQYRRVLGMSPRTACVHLSADVFARLLTRAVLT